MTVLASAAALMRLVCEHIEESLHGENGHKVWANIAKDLNTGRSQAQCRDHFFREVRAQSLPLIHQPCAGTLCLLCCPELADTDMFPADALFKTTSVVRCVLDPSVRL